MKKIVINKTELNKFMLELIAFDKRYKTQISRLENKAYYAIDIFKNLLRFKFSQELPIPLQIDLIEIWIRTIGSKCQSYIKEC